MFILRTDRRFDIRVTYLLFPFFIVVVPQRIKLLKTVIALWYNKKNVFFLAKRGISIQIYMKRILKNGNVEILYFFILFHFSVALIILKYRSFFFFFFFLTREITETVDNRIRHGSIKSFFSHFWFFIS